MHRLCRPPISKTFNQPMPLKATQKLKTFSTHYTHSSTVNHKQVAKTPYPCLRIQKIIKGVCVCVESIANIIQSSRLQSFSKQTDTEKDQAHETQNDMIHLRKETIKQQNSSKKGGCRSRGRSLPWHLICSRATKPSPSGSGD